MWVYPFPKTQEQIDELVKLIASERVSERTVEQTVDVRVPKILKDTVEMIQSVPKEQTQGPIGEETMEEMPEATKLVPQGRVPECSAGEASDVPVSRGKEEMTEVVQVCPQERLRNRTAEQTVNWALR